MSARDRREELEAALWRVTGSTPDTAVALVDAALKAAEVYAEAVAADEVSAALDINVRIQRETDRRARLVLGAAETYGRAS